MIEVQVSRVFPREKAGRPPERKGKLPKGWIPARVSVSGRRIRCVVLSLEVERYHLGQRKKFCCHERVPVRDCRSWLFIVRNNRKHCSTGQKPGKEREECFYGKQEKKMGHVGGPQRLWCCCVQSQYLLGRARRHMNPKCTRPSGRLCRRLWQSRWH